MRETLEGAALTLASVDPQWVVAALLLYTSSLVVVGVRWHLLLRAVGGRPGPLDTTLANLAGVFVNNALPAARYGGEACRIAALRIRGVATLAQAAASSLWDRLAEMPVIAAAGLVAAPELWRALQRVDRGPHTLVLAAGLSLLAAGVAWLARHRLMGLWQRARTLVPDRRAATWAVLLSAAIWLQDVVRIAVVAAAFDVRLPPGQAAGLTLLALVAGFVPVLGSLGAIEGGLVGALVLLEVPVEQALAITVTERAVSLLFGTLAGAGGFGAMGGRGLWQALRRPATD